VPSLIRHVTGHVRCTFGYDGIAEMFGRLALKFATNYPWKVGRNEVDLAIQRVLD